MSKIKQHQLNAASDKVDKVSDFCSKTFDAADKASQLSDAMEKAAPWLTAALGPVGLAATAIGLIAKAVSKATQVEDPRELRLLACTMAWQCAAIKAIRQTNLRTFFTDQQKVKAALAKKLQALPAPEATDLTTFSYGLAHLHPFVRRADKQLRVVLRAHEIPLDDAEETRVFHRLHEFFVDDLRELLNHPDTKAKFAFFASDLESNRGDERRASLMVQQHADHQRWLFAERPLFDVEPFALRDVYLNTRCGKLTWKQIHHERRDPFKRENGGDEDLLTTALDYLLADTGANEPLIVQGYAGDGKSSFTLRLCARLLESDLDFLPIRVRLKYMPLTGEIFQALSKALEFDDDSLAPDDKDLRGAKLNHDLFNAPHGRHSHLSRYVLILDGWDELEIGASKSFRARVGELLREVRDVFCRGRRAAAVRVILTGRPNAEFDQAGVMDDATTWLTMRRLRAGHLGHYVRQLKRAQAAAPPPTALEVRWQLPQPRLFNQLFFDYRKGEKNQGAGNQLEVLGSPLLAYLVVRLFSEVAAQAGDEMQQRAALAALASDRTRVYRTLTDLVIERAGKLRIEKDNAKQSDHERMPREANAQSLRAKLGYTAAAITAMGYESISRAEWEERLPSELIKRTTADDDPFVKLMISFFLKPNQHAETGLEFAHKSFREYFLAEHLVALLKQHGRHKPGHPVEVDDELGRQRDFKSDHPSYQLSRALSETLAPQWLTGEVVKFLNDLLWWEIDRSFDGALGRNDDKPSESLTPLAQAYGKSVERLTPDEWRNIRDHLADLWAWWIESRHLRPQLRYNERGKVEGTQTPYAYELATTWMTTQSERVTEQSKFPDLHEADAHLGDGLIRLTAPIHYWLALAEGWKGVWPEGEEDATKPLVTATSGPRRCQTTVLIDRKVRGVMFEPCGEPLTDDEANRNSNNSEAVRSVFQSLAARINGASGRYYGLFPSLTFLNGADLKVANLIQLDLNRASLNDTCLNNAKLMGANISDASLFGASLINASLHNATLFLSSFTNTKLTHANLYRVDLDGAMLNGASMEGADLNGASLDSATLAGVNLTNARLFKASFGNWYGDSSDLSNAIGLTAAQLRSLAYLDEDTILPDDPELQQAKAEIIALQKEREALREQDEPQASVDKADEIEAKPSE